MFHVEHRLLSYTKSSKNLIQNLFAGDFPGDFCQVVCCVTDIKGDKLVGRTLSSLIDVQSQAPLLP